MLEAPDSIIAFVRGGKILCLFNLSDEEQKWTLPRPAGEIALGTGNTVLADGILTLPPSGAWFGQL